MDDEVHHRRDETLSKDPENFQLHHVLNHISDGARDVDHVRDQYHLVCNLQVIFPIIEFCLLKLNLHT